MNIVFNECIFAYLCIFFYSSTKYFHEFQSIFVNFRFTDIFVKISTDIYRYIRKIQIPIQQSIFMNFKLSIFVNFRFTDIFVQISTDIYRDFRYIRKIQIPIYP